MPNRTALNRSCSGSHDGNALKPKHTPYRLQANMARQLTGQVMLKLGQNDRALSRPI
jgi:hypothetical protein